MKKSYIVLLSALLALALVVPAGISKAGKPAPPPPPQRPTPNQNQTPRPNKTPNPTHTVIKSIDASSITITDSKKGTETYTITNLTEIDFKGEPAKVTDLKPGMRVVVTVGLDPAQADRISADDPPKKN